MAAWKSLPMRTSISLRIKLPRTGARRILLVRNASYNTYIWSAINEMHRVHFRRTYIHWSAHTRTHTHVHRQIYVEKGDEDIKYLTVANSSILHPQHYGNPSVFKMTFE